MATNNTSTGRMEVPEAREAMDRFKMEVASELGVPLKTVSVLLGHSDIYITANRYTHVLIHHK